MSIPGPQPFLCDTGIEAARPLEWLFYLITVYAGGGFLILAGVLPGLHVSGMAQLITALVIMLGVGLGGDAYTGRKAETSRSQGAHHVG